MVTHTRGVYSTIWFAYFSKESSHLCIFCMPKFDSEIEILGGENKIFNFIHRAIFNWSLFG